MGTSAQDVLAQLREGDAPPASKTPAQQMLDDLRTRDDASLRANVGTALKSNPDTAARSQELAQQTGLPADVAERNFDTVDHQARVNEWDEITKKAPVLRRSMQDPSFAKVAHDDPLLADIEDAFSAGFKGLGGYANQAMKDVNLLVGGAGAKTIDEVHSLLSGKDENAAQDWAFQNLVAPFDEKASAFKLDANASFGEKLAHGTGEVAGFLSEAALTGGESAEASGATALPEFVRATIEHAFKSMSAPAAQSALESAQQVYDKTGDGASALAAGLTQYETTVGTGVLPLNAPGRLVTRAAQGAGVGVVQSELQRQIMNGVLPPELQSKFDAADEGSGMIQSALLAAILGPRSNEAASAKLADAHAQQLADLTTFAENSKLRERSPDQFAQFVQNVAEHNGSPSEVYIDARELHNALQQSDVPASPAIAEQLTEALATGGDVRIPIGEYLAHIAPTDLGKKIAPHVRTSAEGMSADEATTFNQDRLEQMKKQAEQVMEADAEKRDSAQAVHDHILDQLTKANRFTPDVNKAYAAMVRDFYVTNADKLGISSEELYAQHPLRIGAEEIAGEHNLDQLAPEAFTTHDIGHGDVEIRGHDEGQRVAEMILEDQPNTMQVRIAKVAGDRRGEGIGQQLIQKAWEHANSQGKQLVSDRAVSILQLRAYEGLRRKGWTIEYSDPAEVARMLAGTEGEDDVGRLGISSEVPVVKKIEPPASLQQSMQPRASAQLASANAPAPAAGMTRFTHFGNKVVDTLDPEFMGTGMKGAEAARDPVKTVALYGDRAQRESGVGRHEYNVDVPTSRLYDADADPRAFRDQATEPTAYTVDDNGKMIPADTREDFTKFEQMVKDAGYIGYRSNNDGRPQARIFESIPVRQAPELRRMQNSGTLFQLAPEHEPHGFANIKPHLLPDEIGKLRRDTAARLVDMFKSLPADADFESAALAGAAKRGWYAHTTRTLRQVFGDVDAPRFAGLLAALSPQVGVHTNLHNAVKVWSAWDAAGRPTDKDGINQAINDALGESSVLGAWRNNSVRALSAEDATQVTMSGPKVNSFMRNLMGDVQEVTNDTWMANFSLIDQTVFSGGLTKSGPGKSTGYVAMNAKIRRVAKKLGWTPAEVQETVWSWAKTAVELADAAGETRSVEDLVRAGEITDARVAGTVDFATLFKNDASIREILESAGYGDAINAIEAEFGRSRSSEGAGKAGVTPGLLRSARRLDQLRQLRAEDERANRGSAKRAAPEAADEQHADSGLDGLPDSSPGPLPAIKELADAYVRDVLVNKPDVPPHEVYVKADPERGARIAQAYEEAQHNPNDFETQVAYDALIDETLAQYQEVKKLGLKIEMIKPGQKDPYPNGPRELFEDVRNGHLWTFPTESGFGTETSGSGHPLLKPTNEKIGDHTLLANDVFRIVHDVFGHAKEGNGFGPNGEENAWQSHVRMYSPLAARAMTSETRGQNSWVNFGPHGEANRSNQKGTVYAEQKAALLPEWVSKDGLLDGSVQDGAQVLEQSPTHVYTPAELEALYRERNGEPLPVSEEHFRNYMSGMPKGIRDEIENKLFRGEIQFAPEQSLEQPARGQISFTPDGATISLLKNADLSTFLHESGHFFLETYTKLAADPNAPAAIKADMDELLKWLKFTPEEWQKASLEERRSAHEQFARGFEAYLMEGKAPTPEVQSMFSKFRSWLLNVYKSLAQLDVHLTPEVRSVMNRMLVSDHAINDAEQRSKSQPLFGTADEAGMTPEQFKEYQADNQQAHDDAVDQLQSRSIRDMAFAANARARELKKLQADVKEKRDAIREEVTPQVKEEPVYRADRFLKTGEVTTETGETLKTEEAHRFDRHTVEAMGYTADELKKLEPYLRNNGMDPGHVAEMFGYTSGDHLIKELLLAPKLDDAIEAQTDQTMLERHGDITDPASLERAANEAVHNAARTRFVATELNALAKMTGKPKTNIAAAKAFAQQLIARLKIRALKPTQYDAASARAARKAMEHLKAGKLDEAAIEKRNQLVNDYASKAGYAAQTEIQKGVDYLKKFDKDSTRSNLDPEYRDQIDALLERVGLRKVSQKDVERRASLVKWVEQQRAMGFEPTVDESLLNEAQRTPYQDMTVEQFRGLVDAVRNIAHLGKLKHTLLLNGQKRALADAVESAANEVHDNAKRDVVEKLERNTTFEQLKNGVAQFFASHRKFASILRQMSGQRDGGALWDLLVRPLNEAGDHEARMRADATKAMTDLLKPILKDGALNGDKRYIPEIGRSLSREGRIAIALNWGNETNRARVMEGEKWSPTQVRAILDTLTKKEWDFVQGVWDHINSYWPEIAAKEQRVTGSVPEKVEASAVDTKHGTYRGGYYPIKYDPSRSSRAEADTDAELIRQSMQGAYTRATTARGHTKARAESVQRPIRKDLGVAFEHLTQVIHDVTHHEALIDTTRILRSSKLDAAIREHYDPAYLTQLRKTLEDVAKGDTPAQNAFERSINYLRTGATVAGLGWRLTTALLQPLGLTQSMVRIGPKWVGRGMAELFGSPSHVNKAMDQIYQKSDFMRLRAQTMQREISELRGQIHGGEKMSKMKASFFYLITRLQTVADAPTWLGQYHKSIEAGVDDATAVAHANQAVLDAQGGGQIKDLAGIQRGGPLQKLWTNFYSFFNTTYNLAAESVHGTDFKKPGDVGRLAADFALLYIIPSVLSTLMHAALKPGDDDELGQQVASDQLNYLLGSMVLVRELGSMMSGHDYKGTPGMRAFFDLATAIQQTQQGELDEAALRAYVNVAGTFLHIPAGQLWTTGAGMYALANGDTQNPTALIAGPPPKN